MTQNHNVVDLDKLRAVPGGNNSTGPLPAPLSKVRDLAIGELKTLLRQLFDNADDALFELADKAGSNGEQAKYFDAMREVRLQRKQIALLMLQSVVRSFNQVGRYKLTGLSSADTTSSLDSLSLVQNDELEERVAIEGMVSKTRSACGQSIDHYEIRVQTLLPHTNLDQAHTPASPEVLVHSFVNGCKDLQVDIEAKLIVYKLFERYVLNDTEKLYTLVNQKLIDDGVMPDLKQVRSGEKRTGAGASKKYSRPTQAGGQANSRSSLVDGDTGEVIAESGGLFENLREMLNSGSNSQPGSTAYSGGHVDTSRTYTEVSRDQVVSALSKVQHEGTLPEGNGATISVINFRSLLIDQMGGAGIEEPQLKKVDEDVINLVSMLFEFILDDRQLQPVMKALIARLQIPMLKVAMLDRNFFNKGGHPARKLLNEIATAAIGWNEKPEGTRDPLKEKVESIVQHLLDDFDNDFSVFESLLSEFTRFLDIENRRGQLIEQRTRDAEEGKAKNESAKGLVQQSIEQIIANKNVPESALTLLEDGWGQYMSLTYLKHGEQSSEWASALTVAENLVWSVCPDQSMPDARSHLLSLIPDLLKRLRAGLSESSFDQFKAGELLKSLEGLHIDALQMLASSASKSSLKSSVTSNNVLREQADSPSLGKPRMSGQDNSMPDAKAEQSNQRDAINSSLDSVLDDVDSILSGVEAQVATPPTSQPVRGEAASKKQAGDTTVTSGDVGASEPTAALDQGIDEPVVKTISETAIDAVATEMIESLRVGSWLEFHEDDKVVRCKLAALIRVTGKYIFVDRSGIKIADKNKQELLQMAQQGQVNILNDGLLFDRALESVIGNLRNNRQD